MLPHRLDRLRSHDAAEIRRQHSSASGSRGGRWRWSVGAMEDFCVSESEFPSLPKYITSQSTGVPADPTSELCHEVNTRRCIGNMDVYVCTPYHSNLTLWLQPNKIHRYSDKCQNTHQNPRWCIQFTLMYNSKFSHLRRWKLGISRLLKEWYMVYQLTNYATIHSKSACLANCSASSTAACSFLDKSASY